MCVLFCVNGYVEAYTCAGVYLEARRGSLIFLALKLQAFVGCLAYNYVGAGIETVALLIMQQGVPPLLRAISPAPRIVLVLDSLCYLILGIK